ncbi:hypothetical protein [Candidatus Tisiphia endosymbiont of Micropterix aruncella]|uniref:hypothetical protein n=1 Tax=Candidatus Tisiphia endosymbiont of Micropterix aruncella TaxID=3066271 RepID=UPI003AA961E5
MNLEEIIRQITTNSITTLDLSNNQIGDTEVKELAEALKDNKSITTLDLSNNHIGDTGAKYLLESLKINKFITVINLVGNEIGEAEAKNIAETLKINRDHTEEVKQEGEELKQQQEAATTEEVKQEGEELKQQQEAATTEEVKQEGEELKQQQETVTTEEVKQEGEELKQQQEAATTEEVKQEGEELKQQQETVTTEEVKQEGEELKQQQEAATTEEVKQEGEELKQQQEAATTEEVKQEGEELKQQQEAATTEEVKQEVLAQQIAEQVGQQESEELEQQAKLKEQEEDTAVKEAARLKAIEEAKEYTPNILVVKSFEVADGNKKPDNDDKTTRPVSSLIREWNKIGDAGVKVLAEPSQINKDFAEKGKQEAKKLKQQQEVVAAEKARQDTITQQITKQARQQESEKLKKQANFRDQEKTEKETTKLKYIKEAKVSKYIQNMFKTADRDNHKAAKKNNQFDRDDHTTIKQVSELIRDGNDCLQERTTVGILLVGNTGAGKSTLAHLLGGKDLKAIRDINGGKLLIDAVHPSKDIIIGHKLASETKIPNKCLDLTKGITIWDCPGFNDTDPVQEIANSFYIKRLFETTEQLKLVLVIPASVFDSCNKRGNDFLETLHNFVKSFRNIEDIYDSISLVFTHVDNGINIQNIQYYMSAAFQNNNTLQEFPRAKKQCKDLIDKLKKAGSIHLFHKPVDEGEVVTHNLLKAIDSFSRYSEVKGDMVNITISKKAMECSAHLFATASSNFSNLLEVIVNAIADATNCLNINPHNLFSEKYHLVKDWVPSSIHYNNRLTKHNKDEYFSELDLLSKLQKALDCAQIVSIPKAIEILQGAVEVFAEYAEPGNVQLQHHIQEYGYCLQQQYEYMKFFAKVCDKELPDHVNIAESITTCYATVTENLEKQVSNLKIDEDKLDQNYYHKAVKYLENYQDSPACKNLKAIAYSRLASIAEKNGENLALCYYVKAIETNSNLHPEIYNKMGQLFFNKGEYGKAIECYKVANSAYKIQVCFKEWLKQDQENPDIMIKYAEYLDSICLPDHAYKYYFRAFSLSEDNNFKNGALEKSKTDATTQRQEFITKVQQQPNHCNYDLVNEEFTNNLLGVAESTSDSCC